MASVLLWGGVKTLGNMTEKTAEAADATSEVTRPKVDGGLPWYVQPVSFLCGDESLSNWSWLTLLLLLLKYLSVSAITNPSVSFAVVFSALATTLGWFYMFVLVGSSSHRLLYAELPFNKVLQTFWVGACVCPVGVYVVRATVGAAIAFIPGVSTLASPKDVMYGGSDSDSDANGGAGGISLAVAFVVAYVAAGLAEELAKYFGLARYFPESSSSSSSSPAARARARDAGTVEEDVHDTGCGGEAAGWYAPLANPRVAVYLAFVVGLGFSWTENIQYGAQVYQSAALWDGHNVTTERNITVTPKWNWTFTATSGGDGLHVPVLIDSREGGEGGEGGGVFIDGGSSTGDGVYGVEGEEEGEIAAAQEGGETLHVYDVDEHGVDVNDQVWEAVEEEEKSTRDVLMAFFFSSPSSTNPLDASLALGRPRRLRFFKKEYSHGALRFLRADDDQFDVLLGGWQEGEERRGVVISSTRGGGEDTRGGGGDGNGGEERAQ